MTLTVPGEVAVALMANRPELLKIGKPRAMDENEVAGMYQVLADLIAERFTSRREIATLRRLMAEAAETLELTEEALKVRLHRARGMLRKELYSLSGAASVAAFQFHASRCDRVARKVLEQILSPKPVT